LDEDRQGFSYVPGDGPGELTRQTKIDFFCLLKHDRPAFSRIFPLLWARREDVKIGNIKIPF
jgi:hypothetical protein